MYPARHFGHPAPVQLQELPVQETRGHVPSHVTLQRPPEQPTSHVAPAAQTKVHALPLQERSHVLPASHVAWHEPPLHETLHLAPRWQVVLHAPPEQLESHSSPAAHTHVLPEQSRFVSPPELLVLEASAPPLEPPPPPVDQS